MTQPLLSVRDPEVKFFTRRATIHAVNGISFDLNPGDTLGIVGESGCGKSVSSLALMGILSKTGRVTQGEVLFEERDLLQLSNSQMRSVRGRQIAMIFQDPMTSLNPVLTIGRQITEVLRTHLQMDKDAARTEAASLLDRVGIPSAKERLKDYPHQFSGGMRQRVMIAMAIACRPRILIADEPTTALDVTIQAQILDLLRGLVAEENMALVLITHDLGVVAGICERTHVMYAGRFVETGTTRDLFARPQHPYTLGLLRSVPRLDQPKQGRLETIKGSPRDQTQILTGCSFAPRCAYATDESWAETPVLREVEPGHRVACWNPVSVDAPTVSAEQGGRS